MDPFLGELRLFPYPGIIPRGWQACAGQLLSIQQNAALFSLLGTTYGGNGTTTFALPDLRGRAPVGVGSGYVQGSQAGTETVTLTAATMPAHNHMLNADSGTTNSQDAAANNFLATGGTPPQLIYGAPNNLVTLDPGTLSQTGGSTPHANMQPFLVLQYCIAINGIFPSRG